MKSVSFSIVGFLAGVFVSYQLFIWFIDRDREILSMHSKVGTAEFILKKYINTDPVEFQCNMLGMVNRSVIGLKRQLENIGSVRFYEPGGTVDVLNKEVIKLQKQIDVVKLDEFNNKCTEIE